MLWATTGGTLAEPVTVTFVETGDISEMAGIGDRGGFARLATIINAERAAGHAFLIHTGNTFSPSLLAGFDGGAHIVDLLNQLRVDVFVPGNHEFDFGPEDFRARLAEITFPVVSTNIFDADGARPLHTVPEHWLEVEGIRIAFYGLTTEETPVISSPGPLYRFDGTLQTGIAKAAELRAAGADIVVALAHTPMAVDLALFRAGAADLILSGHDEHLLTWFDGRVALAESGAQGEWAVVTRLTIDKTTAADGTTSVTWYPAFEIIDTATIAPDPIIAAAVAAYSSRLDAELNVPIGTAGTPIDSRRAAVLGGEATMGNLIADAMRAAVGADVAIVNGGAIRGDVLYPAGTVLTRRDVLTELPFDNRTLKLEVTGAQLLAALENAFSQLKQGAGRFPQVSGMVVEVNSFAPAGSRIVSIRVGNQPLDQRRTYTLAVNDFMAAGGDGYSVLTGTARQIDLNSAQLTTGQVIDFIAAAGTVSPAVEGRIVIY
ncbi:MAG: bifunctional metallophosphatase/5'-nucleotidase [Bauldia sp.]|nr:bifunctional metallophosphatase/5'-nucleotidase [Bauldia sp.]